MPTKVSASGNVKLYLYKDGVSYATLTNQAISGRSQATTTYNSNRITVSGNGDNRNYPILCTTPIDVTGFNYLFIEADVAFSGSTYTSLAFGLQSALPVGDDYTWDKQYYFINYGTAGKIYYGLDISQLTGNMYFLSIINAYTQITWNVYKIWFE